MERDPFPSRTLWSEPEAAALATFKDKHEENDFKVGDAFVVCDAGGGTVDLISYQVTKLEPLRMKEVAIGEGGLCGLACLNMASEKIIITLIGQEEYNRIRLECKKKTMNMFEYGIKRPFEGGPDKDYQVELKGVSDNADKDKLNNTIPVPLFLTLPHRHPKYYSLRGIGPRLRILSLVESEPASACWWKGSR